MIQLVANSQGAFKIIPPLNPFEQKILLALLEGFVIAIAILFLGLLAKLMLERYRIRQSLIADFSKTRIEKTLQIWEQIGRLHVLFNEFLTVELELGDLIVSGSDGNKLTDLETKLFKIEAKINKAFEELDSAIIKDRVWLGKTGKSEFEQYATIFRTMVDDAASIY